VNRTATIRIDGDPVAVAVLTEALRTLLGDAAQIGLPRASTYGKYAGTALARGTVDAAKAAERAADVAARLEQHENQARKP
jgi:hypothetical protein